MFLWFHTLRRGRLLLLCPVVLAILQIHGLHWAGLQGLAWGGMLVSYTGQTGDLPEAIQKTFDGSAPCPLCLAIEEGRRVESAQTKDSGVPPENTVERPAGWHILAPRQSPVICSRPNGLSWAILSLDPASPNRGAAPPDPPPPRASVGFTSV